MDITAVAQALLNAGTLIPTNLVLTEGGAHDAHRSSYFPVDPDNKIIGFHRITGHPVHSTQVTQEENKGDAADEEVVTHKAWHILKALKTKGMLLWVIPLVKELPTFSRPCASYALHTRTTADGLIWIKRFCDELPECGSFEKMFTVLPPLDGQVYRARICKIDTDYHWRAEHGFISRPWRDSMAMWDIEVGSRGTYCVLPPGQLCIPADGVMPIMPSDEGVSSHWRRIGTLVLMRDIRRRFVSISVGSDVLAIDCASVELVLRNGQSATIHNTSRAHIVRVVVVPVYSTVSANIEVPAPLSVLQSWVGPFGVSLRHEYTTADLVARNWKGEDRHTINTLGGDCLVVQVLLEWGAYCMYRDHKVLIATPQDMLAAAGPAFDTTVRSVAQAWVDGETLVKALRGTPLCVLLGTWTNAYEDRIYEKHEWCKEEDEDYEERKQRVRFTMAVPRCCLPASV